MYLKSIGRTEGNRIIKENHYSHTVNTGTKHTLGVFTEEFGLCGVIQLGTGVNPSKTQNLVRGTEKGEFLEVNRMWLADILPHNSESKAISLMFKWLRDNQPNVKWLISFADGVMGKVGTIYQATNWIYTGYNKKGGLWITKDGERYHPVSLHLKFGDTKRSTLEHHLGTPLYRVVGGQFRYIYFLHKREKKNLLVPSLPYPKLDNIKDYLLIKKNNWMDEDLWDEFQSIPEPINTNKWF